VLSPSSLQVGRDYPLGLSYVREQAKAAFRRSSSLSTDKEIHKAVTQGRYVVREMVALIQLKKYRTLRKAYDTPSTNEAADAGMLPEALQARAREAQQNGENTEE
jgi:hypothetical protein